MSDSLPLPKCRADKRGRHHLVAVIPGEDDGWLTLFCEMCGTIRRAPASGHLHDETADMTVDEIERRIYGLG